MAGYADLVERFVSMADTMTATLQGNVTHYAYADATVDDSGKITWGLGTVRPALLTDVNTRMRNSKGEIVQVNTKITFLRLVNIDPRDKIVLPSGESCPIARVSGFHDPNTAKPYLIDVYLSSSGGSGW